MAINIVNDLNASELVTEDFATYCKSIDDLDKDENYYNNIINHVAEALIHSKTTPNGTIGKRLLLWNLLSVAYSDNEYSKTEKDILYIVNHIMEIDESTIQEMEADVATIYTIENEIEFLKNTNRNYQKVQEKLSVLEERKTTIMDSVRELLLD